MGTPLHTHDMLHDSATGAVTAVVSALAFDRRHANRRAVFALHHDLQALGDGQWRIRRRWRGIADEVLGDECVLWHACLGLVQVDARSPSLGERLSAWRVEGEGARGTVFETSRIAHDGADLRSRRLLVPQRAFTLASAPLEIASAWPALLRGARLRRRFLVLKVQRHAAVDLHVHRQDASHVEVALTPVALPLRWLFGRTVFRIRRDGMALETIDGLLDPRDRRRNGRWHEYLGRIEFATPVTLGRVLADSGMAGDAA